VATERVDRGLCLHFARGDPLKLQDLQRLEIPKERPTLELTGEDDTENVDRIFSVMRQSQAMFRRGQELVRIVHIRGKAGIDSLTVPAVQAHVADHAQLYHIKSVEGEEMLMRAPYLPRRLAQHCIERGEKKLDELERVRRVPVYGKGMALLQTTGYHKSAKTYLQCDPLPDQPDGTRLEAAKARIDAWLVDFPFKDDASRANALAMALTPMLAPVVGRSPLFAITAPVHGSGKTLLAETMGIIAHAAMPLKMTFADDEAEVQKRVLAALMQSPPYVLIDNANGTIDSASVATLMTSDHYSGRVLGSTKVVTLANDGVWALTGNNPDFAGEMTRRVCPIRLEPDSERPADREFEHTDLVAWVRHNRGVLIWSLLELVEAWKRAGSPTVRCEWGSYQEWARVCASILAHAGINGFASNRNDIASQGEEDLAHFVRIWLDRPDMRGDCQPIELERLAEEHDVLLAARGGSKSEQWRARKLSNYLRSLQGRVVCNKRITSNIDTRTQRTVFRLEAVH